MADMADMADLVRQAGSGDAWAWEQIVHTWARRVYAAARSSLGDAHAAEDITQGVLLTVYEHITTGRYKETGQFESWLFRIAMNRVRDHARRTTRQRNVQLPSDGHLALSPEHITSEGPATSEVRLRLALSCLSDEDQEVISLRHHAGLSFAAIAETLKQPLGTVLARHHRTLKKLREALSDSETESNNTPDTQAPSDREAS